MKKSEIGKKLQTLKKCGWHYYGWDYHKALPKSAAGWVDVVLLYPRKGIVAFCEIKIGADHHSPAQLKLKSILTSEKFVDHKVIYLTITDKTVDDMVIYLANL